MFFMNKPKEAAMKIVGSLPGPKSPQSESEETPKEIVAKELMAAIKGDDHISFLAAFQSLRALLEAEEEQMEQED